ncbi:MAG: c-type cytochrome [Chloroflexota bacterium]
MNRLKFTSILVLAAILTGCNLSLAADVTPPPGYQPAAAEPQSQATSAPLYPIVAPDPAKGAATFAEKCAPCHGVNGLGDGPQAADLPNPVAALGDIVVARDATPAGWYRIVTEGNLERFMPPFPSLSDRQRWDAVAFALTLSVPQEQAAEGAEIYAAQCAACHGESGRGDGPKAPPNTPDLTNQEFMAGRSASALYTAISAGVGEQMPAFESQLSEDQRWAAAAYLRRLTFASETAEQPASGTALPGEATPAASSAAPAAPASTEIAAAPQVTATQTTTAPLGTIHGTVINASEAALPSGLSVTLHTFDQMSMVMTGTTTVDAGGRFAFEAIEMPAGRAFLTTLEYQKVLYGSDVVVSDGAGQPITLTMQVYDTTTDPSGLSVDRLHYFYELTGENTLRVGELYIISNSGKQTYVGEGGPGAPVLNFMLPPDAANLQVQDGELGDRYIETANGFADTIPVRPGMGNYQVLYSYEVPFTGKLELKRPIQYPTQALVILAPEGALTLKSDALTDGGVRDVQGTNYRTFNGANLAAGSTVDLLISAGPGGGVKLFEVGDSSSLLIGAAALGLVLLAAGGWMYLRSRRSPDGEPEPAEADAPAPALQSKEAVMDAILALDDLYADGKLPEDAYLARRAELKERLAKLVEG